MPVSTQDRVGIPQCGTRFLVADDNKTIRVALCGLIRAMGHEVVGVCNGREAVESGLREDYDFAILDVQMPVMDGLEAAHLLRRPGPGGITPRIFLMSGDPDFATWPGADHRDGFLAKPVRLVDLASAVGPYTTRGAAERAGEGARPGHVLHH